MRPDEVSYLLMLLGILNLIGLVALWIHMDRRGKETSSLNVRVSQLETNFNYLPRHRELTEIRASLAELSNAVAGMRERTEATTLMLRSIQTHLQERSR